MVELSPTNKNKQFLAKQMAEMNIGQTRNQNHQQMYTEPDKTEQ